MNDLKKLAENLRRYNDWRRGADIEVDSAERIGQWIDEAVSILDSLVEADQPAAAPSIAPAIMQAITEDARAEEAFPGNPLARRVEMTGAEIDCLVALVEKGPLWDGDVPSKRGRDSLIDNGLAVRAIVSGADGYTAATYAGRDAYKCHFGTALGGDAGTIDEAKANRQALRAIAKATETKQPKGE